MQRKKTNKMDQKEQFISEMLKKITFSHLCKKTVFQKKGYKWEKRFFKKGKEGLLENMVFQK